MSKCWRSTSIRSTSIKSINISSTSISSIYTCIIYCCQWNISILQNNLILHFLHFEMQCFSKTSLWHVNSFTTHLTQSTILNKIVSSQECWHLMGGFLLCVSLFFFKMMLPRQIDLQWGVLGTNVILLLYAWEVYGILFLFREHHNITKKWIQWMIILFKWGILHLSQKFPPNDNLHMYIFSRS